MPGIMGVCVFSEAPDINARIRSEYTLKRSGRFFRLMTAPLLTELAFEFFDLLAQKVIVESAVYDRRLKVFRYLGGRLFALGPLVPGHKDHHTRSEIVGALELLFERQTV